jgi:mono/diheme cytochrome c family protein
MIRKTRSLVLVFLTMAAVVSLAVWFAYLRNQRVAPVNRSDPGVVIPSSLPEKPTTVAAGPADPARVAAGRAAYERLRCASCHSIAGRGNTNLPLDGVATRHDLKGLRDWTIGDGSARQAMAAGIARMKANFAADPDLPVLIEFLATLR